MSKLMQTIKWAWRAWPLIVTVAIGLVHYTLYQIFSGHSDLFNKVMCSALQLIGGFFVLFSIDQNIGLFQKQNLSILALNWIKSFPWIKRSGVAHMSGVAGIAIAGSGYAFSKKRCEKIEDQLIELERQIDECRSLIFEKERQLNGNIEKAKQELNSAISSNNSELIRLSSVIEDAVVGGFKSQAFGVLLVIYAAVLSVFM